MFGTNGSAKRDLGATPPPNYTGLTFEFVKITQIHTNTQGEQITYIHYDVNSSDPNLSSPPDPLNPNKLSEFAITPFTDANNNQVTADEGKADIYYHNTTQHHNAGDIFYFDIKISENGVKVSEIFGPTPVDSTQDFEGNTVRTSAITFDGNEGISSSDDTFSGLLYYAPPIVTGKLTDRS